MLRLYVKLVDMPESLATKFDKEHSRASGVGTQLYEAVRAVVLDVDFNPPPEGSSRFSLFLQHLPRETKATYLDATGSDFSDFDLSELDKFAVPDAQVLCLHRAKKLSPTLLIDLLGALPRIDIVAVELGTPDAEFEFMQKTALQSDQHFQAFFRRVTWLNYCDVHGSCWRDDVRALVEDAPGLSLASDVVTQLLNFNFQLHRRHNVVRASVLGFQTW